MVASHGLPHCESGQFKFVPSRADSQIATQFIEGTVMKRLFTCLLCAIALGYAITACGGGSDTSTNPDKLTIVGSGS